MDEEVKHLRELVAAQKTEIATHQNVIGEHKAMILQLRVSLDRALKIIDDAIDLAIKQNDELRNG